MGKLLVGNSSVNCNSIDYSCNLHMELMVHREQLLEDNTLHSRLRHHNMLIARGSNLGSSARGTGHKDKFEDMHVDKEA